MKKRTAFECAESLQLSGEDGSMCPAVSVICSALVMIVRCARFLEDQAHCNHSLETISLAILAKTSTGIDFEAKIFRLWGPKLSSPVVEKMMTSPKEISKTKSFTGAIQAKNVMLLIGKTCF